MAVALDVAVGTHAQAASATNVLSTSNTVASGAMICMVIGWFHNGNSTVAMTGGSLTWVEDKALRATSLHISVQHAFAPTGLASGTSLTATYTGATPDSMIGGGSFSGIDTTGTVIITGATNGSTAAWGSGTIASTSGNALIGGSFCDGLTGTSGPTSPGLELFDFNSAGQNETETGVYKLSVSGSDSVDGTWSGAVSWIAGAVCYKAAAAASAASYPLQRRSDAALLLR